MKLWNRLTAMAASLSAPQGGIVANRLGVLEDSKPEIPWLSPGGYLNPNLDTGTDLAGQWQELHDALRDPKAAACLELRCQIVSSQPWTLEARPGTTPEAMDLVREALENLNLVEDFEEMAKAAYFGLVPIEVHWEVRKGRLVPCDLESFDPYYLSFGEHRQPFVNGRAWEQGKLILHRHGSHFRNPWGLGRGRTIPRWVRVKAAVAYATYRDYPRYAHDRLRFTYPEGSSDADQAKFIQIAQKLIDSAGIVVPEGMDAEGIRLESKFETGVKLIEAANGEIATGILGNTLTTGEGKHGTQALGGVHQEQTDRQEVADSRRIEATLNRTLIPWIVALNFGPDAIPPLFKVERQIRAELKDRLDAALKLNEKGLEVSKTWLRTTFGIPAPVDDADELSPEVGEVPPGPGRGGVSALPPPDGGEGEAKLSAEDMPVYGMFDRWMAGSLARQANVARLAQQVLREADSYPFEAVLALAKDFPTTGAEHFNQVLRAARDFGGHEARQEVQALKLDEAPQIDWNLTPEGALQWLLGKVPMGVKTADGIQDSQLRARAFWVAGVEQVGLLQDLQRGMAEGLANGTPWPEFRDAWLPKLEGTGVSANRLKLAYDTQVHSAYMGARMAAFQDDDAVDLLTYVTALDESVRPNHRRMHGVTRPKGDIFWQTHTPPCGYRCRCRLRASEADRPGTPDGDARLTVPPDNGFGEGAPSFASYLNTQARESMTWSPVSPERPGFEWLADTRPSYPLRPARTSQGATPGLVFDATGRAVHAGTLAQALAVQTASEIWLAPVESPEGELALQIAWITPEGLATAVGGVVPQTGFRALDPTPYRQGVRLL